MKFSQLPIILVLFPVVCALGYINALGRLEVEPMVEVHREPMVSEPLYKARTEDVIQHLYIEQKLDHFDDNNNETWQMYYMARSDFYQPGGPIFIIIGSEWKILQSSIDAGYFIDLAKKHNAYVFFTQQRYYGNSQPTEDLSTENLKYLNVQQALADLAYFARTMRSTLTGSEKSKIVWLGPSFSGTMVAWFGRLYPELVNCAWSSCGPLLAKTNLKEYKEEIGKEIKLVGGKKCYDRIQNSFEQVQAMVKSNRIAEVTAMFKICSNFNQNNNMDVSTFFHTISAVFLGHLLFAKPGDIESICSHFDGTVEDYVGLADYTLSKTVVDTCIDMTYKNRLDKLLNITDTTSIDRPWYYQRCNQIGWFDSSDSRDQPFGNMFPLDYFITLCIDLFGKKYTRTYIDEQVDKINEMFGGLNPGVENYFFTQGSLDPLKFLGINNSTIGAVIPWASHNNDIFPVSEDDNIYMRAARKRIADMVEKCVNLD